MTQPPEPRQPDRNLRLVLIESDPVFRAGLGTSLAPFPDLQVVLSLGSSSADRLLLQAQLNAELPDILLLSLHPIHPDTTWEFCQNLRSRHPTLPILLLGSDPTTLAAARTSGAAGFWSKGREPAELVAALRQVAAGQPYWSNTIPIAAPTSPAPTPWSRLKQNLRRSGLRQIETTIAELETQLNSQNLPTLEQLVLAGRRRELRTARWLVNQLLAAPQQSELPSIAPAPSSSPPSIAPSLPAPSIPGALSTTPSARSLRSLQAALFDSLAASLQFSLQNLTATSLEIDILKPEKKQELLYIVLRKLEEVLDDLRFSQVQPPQLAAKRSQILQDLWQAVLNDFFGKYYSLNLGDRQVPLIEGLLQDRAIVEAAILNKIPLVEPVLAHLLFQSPLTIDDAAYDPGTVEAMVRAEILLQNLIIQVANAVMQPLLDRFGDVVDIKQLFYDKRLLSSREIERFRNQLSWKYRVEQWIGEPQAIFESRFNLLIFQEQGIIKTSIYAPRNAELADLSGVQYAVTLALEARDAIAPRLSAAVSFVGTGLVYVLTEVIGRGLGLIGRGVVKGIGNALQDGTSGKSNRSSGR